MSKEIEKYVELLQNIKTRVRKAQIKATLSANSEMINMYYDVGEMIYAQQQIKGWGAKITEKLATDIKNELPKEKGFSERNLKSMVQFYTEYKPVDVIGKQAVSQLPSITKQLVSQIPWGHNIVLMQKIKDLEIRARYIQQIIVEGWTRDTLISQIKNKWYNRQGQVINNFENTLPKPNSQYAQELLKDPYVFDFLTLAEPFNERELETELIKHLEKFLLELGSGFAFVGRQYQL